MLVKGHEIDTLGIVNSWREELIARISNLNSTPHLNIIQIGNNEASNKYVANKINKAKSLGISTEHIHLSEKTTEDDLIRYIKECGQPTILQLPVPKHINVERVMEYLDPTVDVDGFTLVQKGLLANGDKKALVPATALGVLRILKSQIDLCGRKAVIVNRSHLIGKPLTQLLLNENCYVTVLHSRVDMESLREETRSADIVVTGCGLRNVFDSSYFSEEQILVDCSMNRVDGVPGVGDMDKADIMQYLSVAIASGYGHTGLATVMGLMENVVKVYELREKGNN